jgi:citrate synthase
MVEIDGISYLTVEEVCAQLGVKPATVYAYVSRGILRSYRQGIRRQRLYRLDEVQALTTIQPSTRLEIEAEDQAAVSLSYEDDEPQAALPPADRWIGEV